jgi:hypothetical protein
VPIRDIRSASRIGRDPTTTPPGPSAGRRQTVSATFAATLSATTTPTFSATFPRPSRRAAFSIAPSYHLGVARFYSIDDANARLAELRPLLERLRAQREDLVRLRDLAVDRISSVEARGESRAGRPGTETEAEDDEELRRIRMRMQGIVDQMQAAVSQIDDWGITLRDIESGLVDFPALVSGRQVWLCWRLGEGDVDWWHELTTGFGSRRPLAELV